MAADAEPGLFALVREGRIDAADVAVSAVDDEAKVRGALKELVNFEKDFLVKIQALRDIPKVLKRNTSYKKKLVEQLLSILPIAHVEALCTIHESTPLPAVLNIDTAAAYFCNDSFLTQLSFYIPYVTKWDDLAAKCANAREKGFVEFVAQLLQTLSPVTAGRTLNNLLYSPIAHLFHYKNILETLATAKCGKDAVKARNPSHVRRCTMCQANGKMETLVATANERMAAAKDKALVSDLFNELSKSEKEKMQHGLAQREVVKRGLLKFLTDKGVPEGSVELVLFNDFLVLVRGLKDVKMLSENSKLKATADDADEVTFTLRKLDDTGSKPVKFRANAAMDREEWIGAIEHSRARNAKGAAASAPPPEARTIIVAGEWKGASAGGPPGGGLFTQNPQFVLTSETNQSVEITLEQRSTRHKAAVQTARYSGERIAKPDGKETDTVAEQRVTKTMDVTGGSPVVLVPHTQDLAQEGQFNLRVTSQQPVTLTLLQPEYPHVVSEIGVWHGIYAGGSIDADTCHTNPQFFLFLDGHAPTDVVLELTQITPAKSTTNLPIALLILDVEGERLNRAAVMTQEIIADTGNHRHDRTVSYSGQLAYTGHAYTLLPSIFHAGTEGAFCITVKAKSPVRLGKAPTYVEPAVLPHRVSYQGEWKGMTAGGNSDHPTSTNNPMYHLLVSGASPVDVSATLTCAKDANGDYAHIGAALGRNFMDIKEGRLLASTGSFVDMRSVSLNATLPPNPTPYCLLVSTFEPGVEREFVVNIESAESIGITPTVLPVSQEYTHASTWQGKWLPQTGSVALGPFDVPQLSVVADEDCDIVAMLYQTPPPGRPFLEAALRIHDFGGRRVHHGGVPCVADSGQFQDVWEVRVEGQLKGRRDAYTLLPATSQLGVECPFTVVIRSSRPLKIAPFSSLSLDEIGKELISELDTEAKAEAMLEINGCILRRENIDDRISARALLDSFGLNTTIDRLRLAVLDQTKHLVSEYRDGASVDEASPENPVNRAMLAEPLWTVNVRVSAHSKEGVVPLVPSQTVAEAKEAVVKALSLPASEIPFYTLCYPSDDGHGGKKSNPLEDLLPLNTYFVVRKDGLTLSWEPMHLNVVALFGGSRVIHIADVMAKAGSVVARISEAHRLVPIDYGLYVMNTSAPLSELGRGALPPGTWLDDAADLTAAVVPGRGVAACKTVICARRPHPLVVDVRFFEAFTVKLLLDFGTPVGEVKSLVMGAPELKGHVVPAIFTDCQIFRNDNPKGKEKLRLLALGRSLREEGVVPNETVVLKIVTETERAAATEAGTDASGAIPEGDLDLPAWTDGPVTATNTTTEKNENGETVVAAATFNKIIEAMTGPERPPVTWQETLLLTYPTFTTLPQLLIKLRERFNVPAQSALPQFASLSPADFETNVAENTRKLVKNFVIALAKYFGHHFTAEEWGHLEAASEAMDPKGALPTFVRSHVQANAQASPEGHGMNYALAKDESPLTPFTPSPPKPKVPKRPADKITLADLSLEETARQLAIVDHKAFVAVEGIELVDLAWTKPDKEHVVVNLDAFVQRGNATAAWVAETVLSEPKRAKRGSALQFFIRLAAELRDLRDFHGVASVVRGLTMPAIKRLEFSWEQVPKALMAQLADLEDFLANTTSGKARYETAVAAFPYAIPSASALLAELSSVHESEPDRVGASRLINMRKRRRVRDIVARVRAWQHSDCNFVPVPAIQFHLIAHAAPSEEALVELSLQREPHGADRKSIA